MVDDRCRQDTVRAEKDRLALGVVEGVLSVVVVVKER